MSITIKTPKADSPYRYVWIDGALYLMYRDAAGAWHLGDAESRQDTIHYLRTQEVAL